MQKNKGMLAIVVLVLVVAISAGWQWYQSRQQSGLTLYGNVDIRTVETSFRVGGRLQTLLVDEGDKVVQGQKLGTLDAAPYQNALAQAQAAMDTASAAYSLAQAGYRSEEIAQAQAAVHQARAARDYAASFFVRQQGLWNNRIIAADTLANARSARDQAEANLRAAEEKLQQYHTGNRPQDIEQAKSNLAQANAQLAQAKLNLLDTTLYAPTNGTVMTRTVEPGTMLNAGNPVLTLSLTRPIWIRAYVDEANLQQVLPGTKVLITTDGRPDKPWHGQIGFVSPTAEFTPKSVETPELRTSLVYRLRIIVTDPDDTLRQGTPVTLQFAPGAPHDGLF